MCHEIIWYLSLSELFHLARCPQGPLMLSQMAVIDLFFLIVNNFILFFQFFKQMPFIYLFYCCSSIIVSISPYPNSPPWLPPWNLPLFSLSMCSLYMFLDSPSPIFPHYPSPSGYCQFVYYISLFPCLWLYFACLIVLSIRFYLYVRSYGICLSPPGLFHLL